MRDDPRKQFKDRSTVSWQAHEIAYVQKQTSKELPGKRAQQLQSAIDPCKRYIQPAEGREKLLACIREKLQECSAS